jgi:hypothetical protein
MDTPRIERPGIGRRTLIKRAAVAGAVVWTAPVIIDSLGSPAAAFSPTPGCKSVQVAAGNCTTSATVTNGAAACNPTNWNSATCPAFAAAQTLSTALCITASPACATTTSPISFTIGTGCSSCTFTAGIAQSNGSGSNACTPGILTNANRTITFTFAGNASAWVAFRLILNCVS